MKASKMTQTLFKKPSHEIFHVSGEKDKAFWTKIGIGFENRDGKGINLCINYMPIGEGNMVVRKITPKKESK